MGSSSLRAIMGRIEGASLPERFIDDLKFLLERVREKLGLALHFASSFPGVLEAIAEKIEDMPPFLVQEVAIPQRLKIEQILKWRLSAGEITPVADTVVIPLPPRLETLGNLSDLIEAKNHAQDIAVRIKTPRVHQRWVRWLIHALLQDPFQESWSSIVPVDLYSSSEAKPSRFREAARRADIQEIFESLIGPRGADRLERILELDAITS